MSLYFSEDEKHHTLIGEQMQTVIQINNSVTQAIPKNIQVYLLYYIESHSHNYLFFSIMSRQT